ncbi:MAG: hypothetical protein JXR84_24530 [Anaerolineae bacterium]|nr:hypothetical protein [Anaerolineae bacterium]
MSRKRVLLQIMSLGLALLLLSACSIPQPNATPPTATPMPTITPLPTATAEPPTATPEPLQQILFVGNSFTFYNKGLDFHMEQLASSANPPLVVQATRSVMSGAWLEQLWKYGNARQLIDKYDYDVVVLQEDIPETDVDTFHEYARKFVAEIEGTGARPVLFMAWAYERRGWITMEEIAQAHRDIATELGIDVAPVGLAWQRAMEERPELDMYSLDKEHPSIYGTYLAINVVYATIYEKSPVGLTYLPDGITEEDAAFLQRIAWETVQEYQARQ